VKLLGNAGLKIPFAVLTDSDPTDGGKNLGEDRVLGLLPHLVPTESTKGKSRVELLALAKASGLFLNDYTLEVDLFRCGRHKSVCKTMTQLSEVQVTKRRAEGWMSDPSTLEAKRFLADIEEIGKGRFAQRLAGNMAGSRCPAYIKEAIEYVIRQIG
jgi:putative ATP-dependent endonuclease of OLD family